MISDPIRQAASFAYVIDRHLRTYLPAHRDLRRQVGGVAARWLQAEPGRPCEDLDRTLGPFIPMVPDLNVIGRLLAWSIEETRHQGAKASDMAVRVLDGLSTDTLDWNALLALGLQFQASHHRYTGQDPVTRPTASVIALPLPNNGHVATRVVSEMELTRLCALLWSCDPRICGHYTNLLREETLEFWRIDRSEETGALSAFVTLDAEDGVFDQIHFAGEWIRSLACRRVIQEFQTVRAGSQELPRHRMFPLDKLGSYRLFVDPVPADIHIGGTTARFRGADWRFEAALGVLGASVSVLPAAHERDSPFCAWVLRDPKAIEEVGDASLLWWVGPFVDDEEEMDIEEDRPLVLGSPDRTLCEARIRTALRRACRQDRALAALCEQAFSRADRAFREDWLGWHEFGERL